MSNINFLNILNNIYYKTIKFKLVGNIDTKINNSPAVPYLALSSFFFFFTTTTDDDDDDDDDDHDITELMYPDF